MSKRLIAGVIFLTLLASLSNVSAQSRLGIGGDSKNFFGGDSKWEDLGGGVKIQRNYHQDGKLFSESRYENGKLKGEGTQKEGELDAIFKSYHDNGQLWKVGNMIEGEMDGLWKIYNKNGELDYELTYEMGRTYY